MKLEQPKELNCLRLQPRSWASRWRLFISLTPILLLTSVIMVERVLLSWLTGQFTNTLTLRIVGAGIAPFLVVFLVILIIPNFDLFVRPTLEFRDKWLVLQPCRTRLIPWDRVVAFQLAPLPGHPGLTLLNIVSKPLGNRKLWRKWPMILDRATQVPLLRTELNLRRESYPSILVQEFTEPIPQRPARRLRGLGPYLLGAFLVIHGVIPLIVLPMRGAEGRDPYREQVALNPTLARVVQQHFSSFAAFRRFLFASGSILAGTGAVSMCWAIVIMRRETKAAEAQAEFDFSRESALARNDVRLP